MSSKLVGRAIVAAVVLAAIGGALAAHFVSSAQLESRHSSRLEGARKGIEDQLNRSAYYLQDLADMVGVHDDADEKEFSRYAHVRGRTEGAIRSVQWLRRSPGGRLAPSGDTPPGVNIRHPLLIAPGGRNRSLANAATSIVARSAVRAASLGKRVAVSAPLQLSSGGQGFYLAVPIEAHAFSGNVSRIESRSAIVGLLDAQAFLDAAFAGQDEPPLALRDEGTLLGRIGRAPIGDPVSAMVPAAGRSWGVSVAGGGIPAFEQALPWLILAIGLAIAAGVALVLRTSFLRRESAEGELAVSLRRVERANRELEVAHADAERRSRQDPLTGIFNRRHFLEVLGAELAGSSDASARGPAVLLVDLDRFKRINDRHGHSQGDLALQQATARIGTALGERDCLARWGGEEFAVLSPDSDRDSAAALAERIRAALGGEPLEIDGEQVTLTLSVGAALADDSVRTAEALFDAADQALYEAKHAGRNCVRLAGAGGTPDHEGSRA